eukprot:PITA_35933
MDFITGLSIVQGKDCIYVMVDKLAKFSHFFVISAQSSVSHVAELFFKEVFRLHNLPKAIVNDRDNKFIGGFWQELFRLVDIELTPSTSYHLQTDGKTKIVIKWLEGYLRNYVTGHQCAWIQWLHLGEYYYNTTYHMSIGMSPFRALQSTLKQKGVEKVKPRFYGPYRVTRRVGEVAYERELPPGSRVHNIFHVSSLIKALGQQVTTTTELPPMDDEGHLVLEPEDILDTHERHLRNRVIKDFLIRWRNLADEDATWEAEEILQHRSLQLLEDKQHFGREDCDIPI